MTKYLIQGIEYSFPEIDRLILESYKEQKSEVKVKEVSDLFKKVKIRR